MISLKDREAVKMILLIMLMIIITAYVMSSNLEHEKKIGYYTVAGILVGLMLLGAIIT